MTTAILAGTLVSLGAAAALAVHHLLAVRAEAVVRACHELRGPLTAARLGLELETRAGELSSKRLRAIDLELERAALALDDLAAAPGLRQPRPAALAQRDFDVRQLVQDSVEAWRGTAQARGAALEFSWIGAPGCVRGDRLRVAQATGNLIANAIEHGGGRIEVRGSCRAGMIRIDVIDGGAGLSLPLDQLARKAPRRRSARGRGLAIARSAAALHGGRLSAAPSDRGARLVLELPAASARPRRTGT